MKDFKIKYLNHENETFPVTTVKFLVSEGYSNYISEGTVFVYKDEVVVLAIGPGVWLTIEAAE